MQTGRNGTKTGKQTAKTANTESLSERIRRTRPWESSTGPRTHLGKASSAQNARKHTPRTVPTVAALKEDVRAFEALLRLHRRSPLMAIFGQGLRVDLIEQLTLRYRPLHGLDFDSALQRVRRLIESERNCATITSSANKIPPGLGQTGQSCRRRGRMVSQCAVVCGTLHQVPKRQPQPQPICGKGWGFLFGHHSTLRYHPSPSRSHPRALVME